MKVHGIILLAVILLSACGEQQSDIPTYKVVEQAFELVVPAVGEVEAAEAISITSPGRRPMMIAWLEQEYTSVKKGQVVARFDGEQLSLDMREEQLEMLLLEQDMSQQSLKGEKDQKSIGSEQNLVGKEFAFAEEFAIDDLRLYSKLEIIDKLQNKDYLAAKDDYLDWKKQSVEQQSDSALDVLKIKKGGHQAKYDMHKTALGKLEIKAPYDGLLVYQSNWRGEKPTIGGTVFPGNTIAKIPNLDKMQAKVYVLDKEAIGLSKGQSVTVTLDAYPEQNFSGKVSEVAGFPRTISRGNPTKYIEVIISLDDKANPNFKPGRKLKAQIQVRKEQSKVLVPLQSIVQHDGQSFVFVKQALSFTKQAVTLGNKNLHFVEVTSGLTPGEQVALATQELM